MSLSIDTLNEQFAKHPKTAAESYVYGTAGFRMKAVKLDSTVFRVGVLAALRSMKLGSKTIGVMITASHNPPEDNGVKIVDPMGEMLDQTWEPLATKLANAHDFNDFVEQIKTIIETEKINLDTKANVIVARDTRESGSALLEAAVDGFEAMEAAHESFGELTTPQLHYLTRCFNDPNFGKPTETGYNRKLTRTVEKILALWDVKEPLQITVDAANGVGGPKLAALKSDMIALKVVNDNTEDPAALNVACGADYVKTNQKLPAGVVNPEPLSLYASFDGDADRVVFYYTAQDGSFRLLDGDRIATLLAEFIKGLFTQVPALEKELGVGIVQTAYANGSSTRYIEERLQVPVSFTPTGVKHLHHKALEYDVGVYFEANGHGTVVFSQKYVETLQKQTATSEKEKRAIETLQLLVDLINQTVGDSISDLLAVLVALRLTGKSAEEWSQTYTELPNRLFKVIVKDRFMFKTTNAERQLVEPQGLQDRIDEVVARYLNGRSFVRASGTEDAVRVYAEAESEEGCFELGEAVCELVRGFN